MKKEQYIGATIIATIVFWVLNVTGGLVLEWHGFVRSLFSATWKAAIFAVLFHIIHNFLVDKLKWYQGNK